MMFLRALTRKGAEMAISLSELFEALRIMVQEMTIIVHVSILINVRKSTCRYSALESKGQ